METTVITTAVHFEEIEYCNFTTLDASASPKCRPSAEIQDMVL